jgi:hypothetical protein
MALFIKADFLFFLLKMFRVVVKVFRGLLKYYKLTKTFFIFFGLNLERLNHQLEDLLLGLKDL